MNRPFKIGQMVEVTNKNHMPMEIGSTGKIVNMEMADGDQLISVDFGEFGEWYYNPTDLKKVFDPRPESPTVNSNVGIKHDQGKAPISLIPTVAIMGMADVFAFGAQKYGRHNFRKGMDHSRVLDAAQRHLLAIADGEDTDSESGKPHWAHALCCLAMYAFMHTAGVGKDDRYKKGEQSNG